MGKEGDGGDEGDEGGGGEEGDSQLPTCHDQKEGQNPQKGGIFSQKVKMLDKKG